MKRAIVTLVALVALAGAVVGQAGAANAAPASTERLQSLDQALLDSVNSVRTANGLRRLTLDPGLVDAAVDHSRSMLESGYFEHESADGSSFVARVKRYYSPVGYASWSAGENLLYSTEAVDAKIAMEAWLASPGHRENLLDPDWRDIGIGSLHAASAGGTFGGDPVWIITMDFGARFGTPGKIPATTRDVKTKTKAKTKSKKAKGQAKGKPKVVVENISKPVKPKPAAPPAPKQPTEPQSPFTPPTPPTDPADAPAAQDGSGDAAPPTGTSADAADAQSPPAAGHDGLFGDDA
jgi:uncharacterized protein YkwD